MPTFAAPLPPSRATGDAPPEGVAGDVNDLTDAVIELRGKVPEAVSLEGYARLADLPTVPDVSALYNGGTIYVSPTGSDANAGTTAASPVQTFTAAFAALAARGPILGGQWEVVAAAGTYAAPTAATLRALSTNRIVVRGPDVAGGTPTAIIDGAGGSAYDHGLRASGVGVRVEFRDLAFVNFTAGGGDTTRIGCVIENGADGVTTNVHATGSSWCGIYATSATRVMVNGGTLNGNRSGVVYNNTGGTIAGVTVRNSTESGIYWSRGSQGHIDNCAVEDNAIGVVVAENARADLVGNNFKRNSYGWRTRTGGVVDEGGTPNVFNAGTADAQLIADTESYAYSGRHGELTSAQSEVRVAYDRANRTVTGVTAATDLATVWTIPARRLVGPGKQVRVRCFGIYTVTGGTTIAVVFGGMTLNLTVTGAGSGLIFEVDVTLMEVAGGYRAVGHLSQGVNGIRHGSASSGFTATADQAVTIRTTPAAATDSVTLYRTDVYVTG